MSDPLRICYTQYAIVKEGCVMFKRRIGAHPHHLIDGGTTDSHGKVGCPDVWELESGDFAVIGIDKTSEFAPHLPPDASCGPDERIILVERRILLGAKQNLPSE
jgi:hypothetical protein